MAQVVERVHKRNAELIILRKAGNYSTGTLLSDEMQSNLFMVTFLEKDESATVARQTLNWVYEGFQPMDMLLEREYVSPE